jgi:hypothetical protein
MRLIWQITLGTVGFVAVAFGLLFVLTVMSNLREVITLQKIIDFLVNYSAYLPYLIPHIVILLLMWWLGCFRALREGCRVVTKPVRLMICGATMGLYALSSYFWSPLLVGLHERLGADLSGSILSRNATGVALGLVMVLVLAFALTFTTNLIRSE